MIAEVDLPSDDAEIDTRKYDDEKKEIGGFGGVCVWCVCAVHLQCRILATVLCGLCRDVVVCQWEELWNGTTHGSPCHANAVR